MAQAVCLRPDLSGRQVEMQVHRPRVSQALLEPNYRRVDENIVCLRQVIGSSRLCSQFATIREGGYFPCWKNLHHSGQEFVARIARPGVAGERVDCYQTFFNSSLA
jgi:hypothetical protein